MAGDPIMAPRAELMPLTGLRGIAALLVILNHYAVWCSPYPIREYPYLFHVGGIGMSSFFTLSGFVIAYNYSRLPWSRRAFKSFCFFLWMRISRLYPCLLLFMIFYIAAPDWSALIASHFWLATLATLGSIGGIYPAQLSPGITLADCYSLSWSISTEMVMYVVFAGWMIVWSSAEKYARRILCLGAILYFLFLLWLAFDTSSLLGIIAQLPVAVAPLRDDDIARWFFYLSPWFRIVDFACGALAARAFDRGTAVGAKGQLAALAAIIAVEVVETAAGGGEYRFAQLLTAPAVAVLMLGVAQQSWLNRVLASPMLVGVGTVSYSLYLMHIFAPRIVFRADEHSPLVGLYYALNIGLTGFSAICLAVGLHRMLEMPAQRWLRSWLTRSPPAGEGASVKFRVPGLTYPDRTPT
jgi:peptidoglycan/LPS O-acetylase OafA/YrhL